MKRFVLAAMLLASYSICYPQACCCTGSGANYSILPNINKHIIGLRWTYGSYDNVTFSLNPELNGMKNHERFNSVELFGRFNLNKRFQFSAFIPVSFIRQYSSIQNKHSNGLGDMSFMVQYAVLDPLKCTGKKSKHQLRIGLGTKLPSGEFKKNDNNLYNTSVQLGSGSIDFFANAIYTYRFKKFGLNAKAAYKLNTVNPETFRYGDKVDGGANVFYVIEAKKLMLMPAVGINYAHLFNNYDRGQPVYYSSSDLISASVSLEAGIGNFAFSASVLPVLYNKVNNMAFKQRFTTEVGVFYTFEQPKTKKKI